MTGETLVENFGTSMGELWICQNFKKKYWNFKVRFWMNVRCFVLQVKQYGIIWAIT